MYKHEQLFLQVLLQDNISSISTGQQITNQAYCYVVYAGVPQSSVSKEKSTKNGLAQTTGAIREYKGPYNSSDAICI